MSKDNKTIGNFGENIAAKYLNNHGFHIIDKNWEIDFGEIDIIAIKNKTTYFIEVKTQFENQQTSPIDELTPRKISKLEKLAEAYAASHQNIPQKLMLSAVCIWLDYDKNPKEVKWIENLLE